MAYYTKQQVKQILDNAPPNLDKRKLVEELAKTNQIEGYNDTQETPSETPILEQDKKSVGGFLGNVVRSGAGLVKDIGEAVIHPVQTVKNLGKTAVGGVEKLIPGQQEYEQNFDALTGFFKERYGSLDAIKETVYNDPIGFAADLSTMLGGGGTLLKAGGTISRASKVAKAGEFLSKTGELVNPLVAPTEVAKAVIPRQAASAAAMKLYQSALKPSTRLSDTERANVILTGLKEGIPVSKSGLNVLDNTIDEINGRISSVIKNAVSEGVNVSTESVVKHLDDLKDFTNRTLTPEYYLRQIKEIESEFLSHPLAKTGELPIDVAQSIKQNTYKLLRKAYGELKDTQIEAQKALARGLKNEIASQFPEINTLNSKETALINFQNELERAVGRIGNRDLVGLGEQVAGAVNPLAGLVKRIIDTPEVKSKFAIVLQKVADKKKTQPGKLRRILAPISRLPASQENTTP